MGVPQLKKNKEKNKEKKYIYIYLLTNKFPSLKRPLNHKKFI